MPRLAILVVLMSALAVACDERTGASPPIDAVVDVIEVDRGPDAAESLDLGLDRGAPDRGPQLDAELDAAIDGASDAAPMPDRGQPPCMPDPDPALEPQAIGPWEVQVDPATGAWAVARPDDHAIVMRSAARCVDGERRPVLRVGRGTPGIEAAFGDYRIDLTGRASRIDWQRPSPAPPVIERAPDGVRLHYSIGPDEATLVFSGDRDGLRIALEADEGLDAGEFAWQCGVDSAFFGLGTQVIGPDLRGHRFPLWTQEQGIGKPPDGQPFPLANVPEAAYAPMGVWHGSDGYAALLTHDAYSELDLCAADADRVVLRSFGALPGFVLVPGINAAERMEAVSRRVGRPPDPPAWVFAPWNDAVGGPARIEAVATLLRRAGVPSSAIWTEDWIGGEQTGTGFRLSYAWEWDREAYPNLPAQIADLHRRGFAFLAYFNPFVPEPTRMFAEGRAGGFLIRDADGDVLTFSDPAFRRASLVDLTSPPAVDWLRGYLDRAAGELGIDGWMADFAEWLPVQARLASGEDGWRYHNRYPLAWQRVNRDALRAAHGPDSSEPANNWTFFVRSGWASVNGGTAGLAPALWAGDQNTDWSRDDGLPTVISIGMNVGLAGVAVFGSDIAGYTSETVPNTTKELFLRWSSMGAFHPLMRTHHGSDECGNWAFDRDPDTLAHYRRYARVHTLLYPYLRARMDEALLDGRPIVRHPYLVEPAASGLWRLARDQYFLGSALLVAPVVEEGVAQRRVHLPGDGWWPLFGTAPLGPGEPREGRVVEHLVAAPPTEIPVFVRPGTALPLLERAVDSFYGAEAEDMTDLDDVRNARRLALYPNSAGTIRPVDVGGVRVEGGNFTARPNWWLATVAGEPLPACADVGPDVSCVDDLGLRLVGVATTTVQVGAAVLNLRGDRPMRWRIGWAGEGFGDLAEPTPLGELNPDVPPPCEGEPD